MTANEIFSALDYAVVGLEILALAVFLFFSYQKASQLFFGGKKDISSDADALLHSCFIVAISVAVFHFTTSTIRDLVLGLQLEKTDLRQVFYFVMFLMELAFISCVFALHKLRECEFSGVARIAMLLGLVMCINQMIQYYSHGMQGSDLYNLYYRAVIIFVNISTLLAISVYPVFSLRRLKKQY